MVLANKTSIYYVIFILAIGAALTGLLFLRSGGSTPVPFDTNAVLSGATVSIPVAIADTPVLREQGLSGTSSLPEGAGMLFVFDTPGNYGFWMKDMNYALDFIWLDADMTIVDITTNVAPDTYPKVFYPAQPAMYMAEVNANFSTAHGLQRGQKMELMKK